MNKLLLIALLRLVPAMSLAFSFDDNENQGKYTANKATRYDLNSDFDWNSEDEDTDEPKEERGEVNGYIVVGKDDNPLSGPMQKSADLIFRSIGRLLGRIIRRSRRRRCRRRQG
ncbi:hypothetical protein AWC38_SpisGene17897 [Stylophora pistillata]|uniref:Uncharacterized protein n=1 Tax=Stylophora pistillata TaxID=50429 RepID=A0A2B4RN51_STYPI|nr:hypothetical protein AWC38_SpisGene17897 [Stylophora pistillata]